MKFALLLFFGLFGEGENLELRHQHIHSLSKDIHTPWDLKQ